MLLIHTVIKQVVNSEFGCYQDKFSNLDYAKLTTKCNLQRAPIVNYSN